MSAIYLSKPNYFYYFNGKILVDIFDFFNKLKAGLKKFLGLTGIIFFYIPLYYTLFVPLILIIINISYRKNKNIEKTLQYFKKLSREEQEEYLSKIIKLNEIYRLISLNLRKSKSKIIKTNIIYLNFAKMKELFNDTETELTALLPSDTYEVPNKTDRELIKLMRTHKENSKAVFV